MDVETQFLSQEQALASEIFDKLADAYRTGENVRNVRCRAIAAACIVAFSTDENRWYGVLDAAMIDRDITTTFSEQPPIQQRYQLRSAMYETGLITTRCKTLLQELETLNTTDR